MHIFNLQGENNIQGTLGSNITAVSEESEGIWLQLDNSECLWISLRPADYIGPEAFHYIDDAKGIYMIE